MSSRNGDRFAVIERRGYQEIELFEGESLEEVLDMIDDKTGGGRNGSRP